MENRLKEKGGKEKLNIEFMIKTKNELKLPSKLNDKIYNQKVSNLGSRILLTEKQEFIYDDKKRLIKILHKDRYDKLLGYTKYRYKKLKKRARL